MLNRDNLVGFLLLGLCAAFAAVMVYFIAIGERPHLDLGTPATIGLAVVFFGLLVYGAIRGGVFRRLRGEQGGPQWPDPATGRRGKRSVWDRLRGR